MNDVLKTIKERFSCRGYTGELIDKEKLIAIGNAALQSPSSRDSQNWEIIIIHNKELLDEMNDAAMQHLKDTDNVVTYNRIMERGGQIFYNTSCMFLVVTPPNAHAEVALDCGIVAQNIALAAQSLGLGNVIARMCEFPFVSAKSEEFKKRVGWKPGYNYGIGVLVGVCNKSKDPHETDPTKLNYID